MANAASRGRTRSRTTAGRMTPAQSQYKKKCQKGTKPKGKKCIKVKKKAKGTPSLAAGRASPAKQLKKDAGGAVSKPPYPRPMGDRVERTGVVRKAELQLAASVALLVALALVLLTAPSASARVGAGRIPALALSWLAPTPADGKTFTVTPGTKLTVRCGGRPRSSTRIWPAAWRGRGPDQQGRGADRRSSTGHRRRLAWEHMCSCSWRAVPRHGVPPPVALRPGRPRGATGNGQSTPLSSPASPAGRTCSGRGRPGATVAVLARRHAADDLDLGQDAEPRAPARAGADAQGRIGFASGCRSCRTTPPAGCWPSATPSLCDVPGHLPQLFVATLYRSGPRSSHSDRRGQAYWPTRTAISTFGRC